MTRLFNDPAAFADEMVEGFVAAHSEHVRRVSGGVVRATDSVPGTVALVIGGGSGHYPAFGGLVGAGLAHGAAMGNLFASPSAQQVHSVAAAADLGGGILLSYGNYAGDVLHFTQAQERLRAEGVDCRTVIVTDDVASAPAEDAELRRGIAGDLTVFKVAGAAAEEGRSLDDVERLARLANDRTRSFGVAFTGCTLPGADAPLFTVPPGRMGVGMGIHGEPGIDELDVPSADGIAELLVSRLLTELPDDVGVAAGHRVAVILNGLGSVKYEELFVVYRRVSRMLAEAGVTIVAPEVGELVTSFDMAGVSLTLFWLGEAAGGELERLWCAPVNAPALRRGTMPARARTVVVETSDVVAAIPPASFESRASAAVAADALRAISLMIDGNADELGRIDAVAGDGDHGIGMQRGASAAADAAAVACDQTAGLGTTLERAADAWSDRAGGTSGALWGAMLRAAARVLGDEAAPRPDLVAHAVQAAREAIVAAGGAQLGDKTMVDAIIPFADTLSSEVDDGADLATALARATAAARHAADATAQLLPRLGRARPHAERSLGTADAGAVSFALIAETLAALAAETDSP